MFLGRYGSCEGLPGTPNNLVNRGSGDSAGVCRGLVTPSEWFVTETETGKR